MNRAAVPLSDNEVVDRKYFIDSWLGEKSDKDVKRAALTYLGENGRAEDVPAIPNERTSNKKPNPYIHIDIRIFTLSSDRQFQKLYPMHI